MMLCRPRKLATFSFSITSMLLGACAHLPDSAAQDDGLTLASITQAEPVAAVAFDEQIGLATYTSGAGQEEKVEWMACKPKAAKFAVMLVHGNREVNNPKTFCSGWQAQAFLDQGFEVVAVNRPGFGQSTGRRDFAGADSMTAMAAGASAAAKVLTKPIKGVWAYDSGVVAAGLFARKYGQLDFMLLGGGFFDLDEVRKSTSDESAKQEVTALVKAGGEKALEDRSIAYEVAGFPKTIVVYHGKDDTVAPLQQAKAFADTLATSGYIVKMHVLEGFDHNIVPRNHRRILTVLAHGIAAGK